MSKNNFSFPGPICILNPKRFFASKKLLEIILQFKYNISLKISYQGCRFIIMLMNNNAPFWGKIEKVTERLGCSLSNFCQVDSKIPGHWWMSLKRKQWTYIPLFLPLKHFVNLDHGTEQEWPDTFTNMQLLRITQNILPLHQFWLQGGAKRSQQEDELGHQCFYKTDVGILRQLFSSEHYSMPYV